LRKALPSLLFFAALAGQAFLYRVDPLVATPPGFTRWLALPVFALACVFPLRAAWQFSKARTSVYAFNVPTTLVTTGVFRYTRNPMYLGMLLVLLTVALAASRYLLWIPPLLFIPAMNVIVIRWEEKTLRKQWPETFTQWEKGTPRWLFY